MSQVPAGEKLVSDLPSVTDSNGPLTSHQDRMQKGAYSAQNIVKS